MMLQNDFKHVSRCRRVISKMAPGIRRWPHEADTKNPKNYDQPTHGQPSSPGNLILKGPIRIDNPVDA